MYKMFNISLLAILTGWATGLFANNTPLDDNEINDNKGEIIFIDESAINLDDAQNIRIRIQEIETAYQDFLMERLDLLQANQDLKASFIERLNHELDNFAKWLDQAKIAFELLLGELTHEARLTQENHLSEALNQIEVWFTLVDITLDEIRAENLKADVLKRIRKNRALYTEYFNRSNNLATADLELNPNLAFQIGNRLHAFKAWLDIADDALDQLNQELEDDARIQQVDRLRLALERADFLRNMVEEVLLEMEAQNRRFLGLHAQIDETMVDDAIILAPEPLANRTVAMEDDGVRNNLIINHRALPHDQGGCGG